MSIWHVEGIKSSSDDLSTPTTCRTVLGWRISVEGSRMPLPAYWILLLLLLPAYKLVKQSIAPHVATPGPTLVRKMTAVMSQWNCRPLHPTLTVCVCVEQWETMQTQATQFKSNAVETRTFVTWFFFKRGSLVFPCNGYAVLFRWNVS